MGFEPTTFSMASWHSNHWAIPAIFEQDNRIELSIWHWKCHVITISPILQDKICPSSQTSILFTKALDFSRYCCGSGRIRTYSARRHCIYSAAHLSNCGALPSNNGINKTQTQSRYLNVSEYKDTPFFGLCKQTNVKICNNWIYVLYTTVEWKRRTVISTPQY